MLRRPTIRGFRSGVLLFFVSCRAHRAVTLAQMLCARWNNAVVHPIDIPVDRRGHRQVPARWVAVHTFSGEVGDHSVQEKSEWLIGQVLSSARPSEALGDISSTVISVSPSPRARTAACPALHRTRRSLQGLFRGRFARTATRYTRRRTGRCRPLGAVMRAGGRGSAAADPSRETSRAFARRRGSWRGTTLRSLSRCSRPTRSRKRPPPLRRDGLHCVCGCVAVAAHGARAQSVCHEPRDVPPLRRSISRISAERREDALVAALHASHRSWRGGQHRTG